MIKGQTKNVAINPVANKKIDENENFIPFQIDMRNGRLTDVGSWEKRKGFAQKWSLGTNYPAHSLIDKSVGFAINTNGQVYRLDTVTELTGRRIDGFARPTWTNHDDLIIIAAGGRLTLIKDVGLPSVDTGLAPSGLPNVDFVSRIGDFIVTSTQNETEFRWFLASQLKGTISYEFANVRKEGTIQFQEALNELLYLFMEDTIEVRALLNSNLVVQDFRKLNVGLGARDSVVKANNTMYWYYKGNFYGLIGGAPQMISFNYQDAIDELHSPEFIYGFDYTKDNVVKWFAPVEGRCFVYDYVKNLFYEENLWQYASWQRMPINAYMELSNKQYIGSYEPIGLIYEWSDEYKDDAGDAIRVYRKYAVRLSANGNQARINRLRFRFKSAVGDYGDDRTFCYRIRLDRKQWSDERTVDLRNKGDIEHYHDVYQLGIAREIEVEVVGAADTEFLLTNMELTIKEMGN
jgi:hypothetical protein